MVSKGSRESWYNLFDHISHEPEVPSSIDCLEMCEALCCPRDDMPELRVGLFVVYLPFELEYIVTWLKLNAANLVFNWQDVVWPGGRTVAIPWSRCCPFIHGVSCSIYSLRPLDCRSFPLMASSPSEDLELKINSNCPGYRHVTEEFKLYVTGLWERVYPAIPQGWWDLLDEIKNAQAR